jgi:hypothetical protein
VVPGLPWARALLVWDENDHNVEPGDHRERWEGTINSAYRGFPQEGGPPCGTLNKRYELDADNSGRLRLYYWPADRRLHLAGAEQGTLTADYDADGKVDLTVEYRDRDGDGFFDERTVITREPSCKRLAATAPAATETIPLSFAAVSATWPAQLAGTVAAQDELLAALATATAQPRLPNGPLDFLDTASGKRFPAGPAARRSREARRFYADLEIELLFARLLEGGPGVPELTGTVRERLRQARELLDTGALGEAARALRGEAVAAPAPATPAAGPPSAAQALLGGKITAGWESDVIAYRAYWGKVDVFGKTDRRLHLVDFNRPEADYHLDLGWGMDILHNGLTSGLGGLNLWHADQRQQVQWTKAADPAVPLSYQVLPSRPGEAAIEMRVDGWETPGGRLNLRHTFTIAAGQRHTVSRVQIDRPGDGELEFGPGLVTFPGAEVRSSQENGYVALWGDQGVGAGPVGLAVVFDPALCRRLEPAADEVLVHLAASGARIETVVLLAAAWAKEGTFADAEAWFRYVAGLEVFRGQP